MNKLLLQAILAATVLLNLPVPLQAQWEELPGYNQRDILAMDTFRNRIFMLEDRGILYRSDNHGLTWKALKPGGVATAKVECFAGSGQTLVAYSGTGIWRSDDLGENWSFVLSATASLPPIFTSMVALNGQFFLSRTSGIMRIDLDAKQLVSMYNIPNAHVRLYVSSNDLWATGLSNVYRSSDMGQTWLKYTGFTSAGLAFQGDTVWSIGANAGLLKANFILKSDASQQLHELPLPAAAANTPYRRLTVANNRLYFSYLGQADYFEPATQSWHLFIPSWKGLRVNAIWSDGSFLFALTTKGPARRTPGTGSWNWCNTGLIFTSKPSLLSSGRYLFMYDDFATGSPGGVLVPGPTPVWVTPPHLFASSISETDSGYYAWDDSSRFWRSDASLREWTLVGKGPTQLSPFFYGQVFGVKDTLYSTISNGRLLRSVNGGVDWALYSGLPNEDNWEQLLFTRGGEACFIDSYKKFNYLNTKYNQGLWDKRGTLEGYGRILDKVGNTFYAPTPSKKISISGDLGYTWTTSVTVDNAGVVIPYSDMEVCEAGVFLISSNTAPPGQVFTGLFYAPEVGDPFVRLSFPPFDTLALNAETNRLSWIKYVDGYLYISMSQGQMYRQAFQAQQVHAYSGEIWLDANDNQVRDPDEKGLPNILVRRGKFHFGLTDEQGRYTILDDLDPDTVAVANPWKNWKITPRFYAQTTPGNAFNFAFRPPNYRDFSIEQILYPVLKPGKISFLQLHWQNLSKSNDATIRWAPPAGQAVSVLEYQTPPDAFSGDTAIWHLPVQLPHADGSIYIALETKTDQLPGTPVFFWAEISPVGTDDQPENNLDTATVAVYASFDPNDKQVSPATYTTDDLAAGRPLNYTIRFQNTGNYPASFVYIRDTLDAGLDLNTMELLASSHPCRWHFIGDRVVEFLFDPIDLPDSISNEPGSHGFVRYRIQPLRELGAGDTLQNTAYIYFDFNAPVQTNTVGTVIDTPPLVGASEVPAAVLLVYPNPSTGVVWVEAPGKIGEIAVYDLVGKQVLAAGNPAVAKTGARVDLGTLPPGVYTMQGRLDDGRIAVGRVVRR